MDLPPEVIEQIDSLEVCVGIVRVFWGLCRSLSRPFQPPVASSLLLSPAAPRSSPAPATNPRTTRQESLDNLSGFLQPFLDSTPREVEAALPPLERAKAHVTIAKAVVLLASLRLRLRGAALEEGHPLRREQVRGTRGSGAVVICGLGFLGHIGRRPSQQTTSRAAIKLERHPDSAPLKHHKPPHDPPMQDRLERYDKKLMRAALDDEAARSRPGSDLNVAAANRFITAAIPDLTAEQKRALRGGGGEQQRGGKRGGGAAGAGGAGKRARGAGGKDADLAEILAAAIGGDEGGGGGDEGGAQ